MGTDIHLFVEYDYGNTKRVGLPDKVLGGPFANEERLSLFADGEVCMPRHYPLFACLAGVRNHGDRQPLFVPRGFPVIHSNELMLQFTDNVHDEGQDAYRYEDDVERSRADEWVGNGTSTYFSVPRKRNARVSSPDWHTPSWLYRHEIIAAMEHFGLREDHDVPLEFRVTLDLLASFEKYFGSMHARAVFWFDN
jgi:hypothetical protein